MYFVVINLGLRSIRVIIFSDKGLKLWHKWYPVESILSANYVEQNPKEWWSLAEKLLIEAVDAIPDLKNVESYLSVTCSSCCLISLNKNGDVLYNSIMVSDKRAINEADELRDKYKSHFDFKYEFLPMASYMMSKILWIKNNKPNIHKEVYKYLSPNDFLIYKLTGKFVTDELNAHKYYYSLSYGALHKDILNDYDIDSSLFPDVSHPGKIIGDLNKNLLKKTGLHNNSKVILTTYDALCAFWGAGVTTEGDSCNVVGTVSSFRAVSDKKFKFDSTLLSQEFSIFNKNIIGCSNNLDGGLIEWAKNVFYKDVKVESEIYLKMEEEASCSSAGANGLTFLPYILGERAPFWDEDVRGMFFGIEKYHTRQDFIRSIYESSAYMLRDMVEEVEKSGVQIKNIRLSGGFAKSSLAAELRANITGKEIYILEEEESTALGSCLISMFALNHIKSVNEIKSYVNIKKIVKPDPKKYELYTKLFALYKESYEQNKRIYTMRKQIINEFDKYNSDQFIIKNL